jgi:hypothetical protein
MKRVSCFLKTYCIVFSNIQSDSVRAETNKRLEVMSSSSISFSFSKTSAICFRSGTFKDTAFPKIANLLELFIFERDYIPLYHTMHLVIDRLHTHFITSGYQLTQRRIILFVLVLHNLSRLCKSSGRRQHPLCTEPEFLQSCGAHLQWRHDLPFHK